MKLILAHTHRVLALTGKALSLCALALANGCLERPVAKASPLITNVFVDDVPTRRIDKIDLLLVIDNSKSMGDKQRMLDSAVPGFLGRLVNPSCVSLSDPKNRQAASLYAPFCAPGFQREFDPIDDIHVGIISSSLGGPRGTLCAAESLNDRGHLIPLVRSGVASYESQGFWAWDPRAQQQPPGEADLKQLIFDFTQAVTRVGESGCGFEAPLEAWYRFLIDPEPYGTLEVQAGNTVKVGIDEEILKQRKAFLRPDSLVAIVMLTDENDCSAKDEGLGWLLGAQEFTLNGKPAFNIPAGTSACAEDPNSPCCRNCDLPLPTPANCQAVAEDPACQAGPKDPPNLRCFEQKKRFGLDLLQPIERYVHALQSRTVPDRSGRPVANPLFSDLSQSGQAPRTNDVVFLAGILGVPWQDIATDESLTTPGTLSYLTVAEFSRRGIWANIVGDIALGLSPQDPLMRESIEPRVGKNPRTLEALAPADSTDPHANSINGHEYRSDGSDLQYACVFPLPESSRDCSLSKVGTYCDCGQAPTQARSAQSVLASVQAENRPLCQPPAGGPASTTQFQAKAYPGGRLLEVLQGYGQNSVVASICPKVTTGEATLPSFGYNPALSAIVERIGEKLQGRCLPRKLTPDKTGHVPCRVVEAARAANNTCQCGAGRHRLDGQRNQQDLNLKNSVLTRLQQKGLCGTSTTTACADTCLCEIEESIDKRCLEETGQPAGISGFCYVDPANGLGNSALVSACPTQGQRALRFVGEDLPKAGSDVFYACAGTVDPQLE